jgi:hypothetical protein
VLPIDTGKPGTAGNPVRGLIDGHERQRGASSLRLECFLDVRSHVVAAPDLAHGPAPEILLETDAAQRVEVCQGERLEADMLALQDYGLHVHRSESRL